MNNAKISMQTEVHNWMNAIGFQLNSMATNEKTSTTTRHYFFETFNFLESSKTSEPEKSKFICFDTYGEKIKVKSLRDMQAAFYENISQLK